MGVGGGDDGGFQQTVVVIHGFQRLHDERDKTQVVERGLAGRVEKDAGVGAQRPVVVLAASVDAFKRFLVEKAAEAVLAGHTFHNRHHQHVMVNGEIHLLKDGGQLKLVGGHLIMAGLAGDAQFQCLNLDVAHEILHALRNRAKIMVVHLLVFG